MFIDFIAHKAWFSSNDKQIERRNTWDEDIRFSRSLSLRGMYLFEFRPVEELQNSKTLRVNMAPLYCRINPRALHVTRKLLTWGKTCDIKGEKLVRPDQKLFPHILYIHVGYIPHPYFWSPQKWPCWEEVWQPCKFKSPRNFFFITTHKLYRCFGDTELAVWMYGIVWTRPNFYPTNVADVGAGKHLLRFNEP